MAGGAGNDTYHVDVSADVIVEAADSVAGGIDTVVATRNWVPGTGLEHLRLEGPARLAAADLVP